MIGAAEELAPAVGTAGGVRRPGRGPLDAVPAAKPPSPVRAAPRAAVAPCPVRAGTPGGRAPRGALGALR